MSTHSSTTSCTSIVIKHKCDKLGFRKETPYGKDQKFRCEPYYAKNIVKFPKKGCPLSYGGYDDIENCRPVHDDDIVVGCDLTV